MKTKILTAALLISISLVACKKEEAAKQSITGKWTMESRTLNNFYNDSSHITIHVFPATSFVEFRVDGTYIESSDIGYEESTYGMVDESTVWIGNVFNWWDIRSLTGSGMEMYDKTNNGIGGAVNYTEITTKLKK